MDQDIAFLRAIGFTKVSNQPPSWRRQSVLVSSDGAMWSIMILNRQNGGALAKRTIAIAGVLAILSLR